MKLWECVYCLITSMEGYAPQIMIVRDFIWSTSKPGLSSSLHHWEVLHPGQHKVTQHESREIAPLPDDQLRAKFTMVREFAEL